MGGGNITMCSLNYVYLNIHTQSCMDSHHFLLLYERISACSIVNALLHILLPTQDELNTCSLHFKSEPSLHRPFRLLAGIVYHAHCVLSSCTQVCAPVGRTHTFARILSSEPCPLVLSLSHTHTHTHARRCACMHTVYIKRILSLSLFLTLSLLQQTSPNTNQSKCRQITTDAGRWWATRTSRRSWRPSVSVLLGDTILHCGWHQKLALLLPKVGYV